MRSLPPELLSEISKEAFSIGHLIKITLYNVATQTDVPIYLTDKDMDVHYDLGDGAGVKQYLSRGIEFEGGQQSLSSKVDSIAFEVDNVSLEFSSYVMNYETRGKGCIIYRAAFDDSLQVIGHTVLFPGILDRVEIEYGRARFEVLNSFVAWAMLTPRRHHSATCPWTFKGTNCGYAGALTSCDKSWTQCTERARTADFGGFRWIQSLESGDKQITWGKRPG